MPSKSLGQLTVDLLLKTGNFVRGMGAAERQADKSARAIAKRHKALAADLDRIYRGIGLAAAAAFAAIGVSVKKSVDDMWQMVTVAKQIGMDSESFSALVAVAKDAEVGMDSLSTGLRTMAKNLALAQQGSVQAANAFKALGLDPAKLTDSKTAVLAIADALSHYRDDVNKTAIEQQIFGRSGAELNDLLNQGSAGLTALMDKQREMGNVVTPAATKALAAYDDAADKLNDQITGLRNTLAVELLPTMTKATAQLNGFLQSLRDDGSIQRVTEALQVLLKNLDSIATFFAVRWTVAKAALGLLALRNAIVTTSATLGALRVALIAVGGPLGLVATGLAGAAVLTLKWRKGSAELAGTTDTLTASLQSLHGLTGQAATDARAIAVENVKAALAVQTHVKAELDRYETMQRIAASSTPTSIGPMGALGGGVASVNGALGISEKRMEKLREQLDASRAAVSDMLKELMKPTPTVALPAAPSIKLLSNTGTSKGGGTKQADKDARNYQRTLADLQTQMSELDGVYNRNIASINGITDAEQAFNERMDGANQLLEAGRINWEQYSNIANDALGQLNGKAVETFSSLQQLNNDLMQGMTFAFHGFVSDFSDGIANMMEGGKLGFKSILRDFLKMVERMIIQWLILKAIMGIGGAMGGTENGTDFASSLFRGGSMPARAGGGPVSAGTTYLVGEKGPELFTPSASGTITANNRIATGGGIVVNSAVNVNADNANDDPAAAKQLAKMIEAQTKATVLRAIQPGGILWKQQNRVAA